MRLGTPAQFAALLQPDDLLFAIDLEEAYNAVPLHPLHRHLVRTVLPCGLILEAQVMIFGLSPAPIAFTRLLLPAVHWLRQQGLRLGAYLDDIGLATRPVMSTAAEHLCLVLSLFFELGFSFKAAKLQTRWSHRITYLGVVFDSHNMAVRLPADKLAALRRSARALLKTGQASLRQLASFCGTASWATLVTPEGRLRLRPLLRAKAARLHQLQVVYRRPWSGWQPTHQRL